MLPRWCVPPLSFGPTAPPDFWHTPVCWAITGVQSAGLQPNVPIYTTLMDACVKDGSPASVDLAFKLLDRMRREGLQPSAVTYGCLLVACERRRDVDRAFQLYQDACDEVGGVRCVGGCVGGCSSAVCMC